MKKTLSVLSEIVGLKTELYTTVQNSQRDDQYVSLTQKEADLTLASNQSKLRATCSFVKNQLREIYLSDCIGELELKQSTTNTVEMAKGLLERCQNYAGDSLYGELAAMLNGIDTTTNSTKFAKNVELKVVNTDQKMIDYVWTYTDENGVIAKAKNIILSYDCGYLKCFWNNWPLYRIVSAPTISREEATAIAVEASKNFSYKIDTDNSTLTVSGFKIAPESLGKMTALCYINFKNASSARAGDPFALFPSWYIPLGFDRFYPGDVSSMSVSIWADTGEVSAMGPIVVDRNVLSGVIDKEITSWQTNPNKRGYESTVMSTQTISIIVTVAVGVALCTGKKVRSIVSGKLNAKFWAVLLCTSILFSISIAAVPEVNAETPTPNSKSRIYASLYGDPDQLPPGRGNATEMCAEIADAFTDAGYSTANQCGGGTTRNNVMTDSLFDSLGFHRTAVFHFGHFSTINYGYQDNTGTEITWQDVGYDGGYCKHFFVFLWVCVQAESPTYGAPVGWTHKSDMSSDGYANPDGSGQCYIGFQGFSPIISNFHQTFNDTAPGSPCRNFIEYFYDYALRQGYSVRNALDRASRRYFDGSPYSDSVLNRGYSSWWPGAGAAEFYLDETGYFPDYWRETYPQMWGNQPDNRMRVFGDGAIYLDQISFTALAKEGSNDLGAKDIYIDKPANIANTGASNPIKITSGYHTLWVHDFWEPGYTGWRYYFDYYTDGTEYWMWDDPSLLYFFNQYHNGFTLTVHFTKEYHPGDVDGDRDADGADLTRFLESYPSWRNDPYNYNYDSACDSNADGDVDDEDYANFFGSPSSSIEDFTTYTEVDPNGDITVSSSRVTVDTMRRDVSAYVYKDKGAGHFSGNFEHLVDVRLNSADQDGNWMFWSMWNALGSEDTLRPYNNGVEAMLYRTSDGVAYWLLLREWYGNTNYDSYYTIAPNTAYHLKIARTGSTLTCKIYSDEARTNLLATLSLNLHETAAYRYIYAVQSTASSYEPSATISGYCENLAI